MPSVVYVILGATIGATGRYALTGWVSRVTSTPFPWGTLSVNLLGCFVIGVVWGLGERALWAPSLRTFLFIGILGSFTTFSSFGLETVHQLREQRQQATGVALVLAHGEVPQTGQRDQQDDGADRSQRQEIDRGQAP